eukprot:1937939-Amphidinium_carterae.1
MDCDSMCNKSNSPSCHHINACVSLHRQCGTQDDNTSHFVSVVVQFKESDLFNPFERSTLVARIGKGKCGHLQLRAWLESRSEYKTQLNWKENLDVCTLARLNTRDVGANFFGKSSFGRLSWPLMAGVVCKTTTTTTQKADHVAVLLEAFPYVAHHALEAPDPCRGTGLSSKSLSDDMPSTPSSDDEDTSLYLCPLPMICA